MTELEPTRRAAGDVAPIGADLAAALADINRPLTGREVDLMLDRDTPTMKVSDAAAVLAVAAAMDNRNVDEIMAQEWAYALAGLTPQECITAIRRYRQRTHPTHKGEREEYLMAGRVRELVLELRRERVHAQRMAELRELVEQVHAGTCPGLTTAGDVDTSDDPDDVELVRREKLSNRYQTGVGLIESYEERRRQEADAIRRGAAVSKPHNPLADV